MRAREIMVNVPISISIGDDGEVDVNSPNDEVDTDEEEVDATDGTHSPMQSPLDQELELQKAALGKQSNFIDRMIKGDPAE